MPTYITLTHFTEQGAKNLRESPARAAAFKAAAKKLGVTVKNIFWTLGDYDTVIICEAPDDETAAAAMVSLASRGYVRPKTLRAFTASEMGAVLGKIPASA
jgi:uncharacterized protein with GYD domain